MARGGVVLQKRGFAVMIMRRRLPGDRASKRYYKRMLDKYLGPADVPRESLSTALHSVLEDIDAMSAEEVRAEHDAAANGDLAIALREIYAFGRGGAFKIEMTPPRTGE
jgi:hypothetical protein